MGPTAHVRLEALGSPRLDSLFYQMTTTSEAVQGCLVHLYASVSPSGYGGAFSVGPPEAK